MTIQTYNKETVDALYARVWDLESIKDKLSPPNDGVYVGKQYTLADLHEDLKEKT